MPVIYNEIDGFAADWLEKLIAGGHVAPGRVERRSIEALSADDCADSQCHFFAGIGVWSHALRLAGWPDDRPVWTGSCPCQPFSQAGHGKGVDDERHLWPAWFPLIEKCRPPVIFGEQVASKAGLAWFDTVRADLEGAGYSVGVADLCAAGVGAPHIRQRLYFVGLADDDDAGRGLVRSTELRILGDAPQRNDAHGRGEARGLGDSDERGRRIRSSSSGTQAESEGSGILSRARADVSRASGAVGGLGHHHPGLERRRVGGDGADERASGAPGVAGFWSPAEWIPCSDGKQRPVEPGSFPLAHGTPNRVGRLRGYGNAIVAPLAAEFIRSVMDLID